MYYVAPWLQNQRSAMHSGATVMFVVARGVATGGSLYRYIYSPKISPWKLFCALIAADVVRLL